MSVQVGSKQRSSKQPVLIFFTMPAGKRKKKGIENKKKKSKKAPNKSLTKVVKGWFLDRQPVVKFLLGFVGCMLLFYLFYHSALYKDYLEIPLLHFQASVSNILLTLLGYNTSVSNTIIAGGGFTVDIKSGCDGLEAMAILICGILVFPTPFKLKIPGLLLGIGLLFLLNLLRIAALYMAKVHFSDATFDILHIQGGFILFTMISIMLWFVWMNWCLKKLQQTPAL